MGCGEKTGIHLVLSAVNAVMRPRVAQHVRKLEELIARLDARGRELLASDADLETATRAEGAGVDIPLESSKKEEVRRIAEMIRDLKDLLWRYREGPSGHGRAVTGFANATGCSSVWGSTYPYNPYPFPWTNHLFQDAPSVAIGLFEGNMRKMADGFVAIRRAELELAGQYDPAVHDPVFAKFDWRQFSNEEYRLCPPLFAVGGDGALLDIGFQNVSRLLASGKPLRVVMLDTQVYSNTGGQACTSGFTGQISDMAAYGKDQHGKEETRKEMALIAMAHRGAFVLQSSQALPSHLLAGVIRGLNSRRPAVFVLHCPCPPEHGLGDDQATHAARLSLESRAYPFFLFDPDAGESLADCISLDGNPAQDQAWPSYELKHLDGDGQEKSMELPLTIADWAATEARFKKHFSRVPADAPEDELALFHEYLDLPADERAGRKPFIYAIDAQRKLVRLFASEEMVELAEDRLKLWNQLRELAGQRVSDAARSVVEGSLEADFEKKLAALRAEYEAKLADLKARYPQLVARRLAEGLLKADGKSTIADLLAKAQASSGLPPLSLDTSGLELAAPAGASAVAVAQAPAAAPAAAPKAAEEAEAGLAMEPYIESARCTSCNECTNLNNKMFGYNEKKQAYVKDPRAGTFRELVMAAERCPVKIIHPGTPLNPKEKDLAKWIKRAEPFS
jgi:pyruvate-ferredoxin/flavodoxin oxidoreductase